MLAVSRFIVFQALIDVLVSPFEQAMDQARELVVHGGDGFWGAEFAAEAAILGASRVRVGKGTVDARTR